MVRRWVGGWVDGEWMGWRVGRMVRRWVGGWVNGA